MQYKNKQILVIGKGGLFRQAEKHLHKGYQYYFYEDADGKGELENNKFYGLIVLVSGGIKRKDIYKRFIKYTSKPRIKHEIIAPTTLYDSRLGEECIVLDNCFIEKDVKIGNNCLFNVGAQIHHNSEIRDWVELCPRALILGGCKIGEGSFIGANATVLPKITIGKNCIIGAGSVVTKNIPNNVIAYGNPCKFIKNNI